MLIAIQKRTRMEVEDLQLREDEVEVEEVEDLQLREVEEEEVEVQEEESVALQVGEGRKD